MATYKRILLKLSGESLMGEKQYGIDEKRLAEYAAQIKEIHELGVQIGIVIGGGNRYQQPCLEFGIGSDRRKGTRTDGGPHGTYRRILQQMESH